MRNGIVYGSPQPVRGMTGRLGPQGQVSLEGRAGFADDLLGTGWAVVSLTDARQNLRADRRAFLEGLRMRFLKIARNASRAGNGEAIDLDGVYRRFFSEARVETVLVRPDFYIFGAASSAREFDALVEDLRRQLVRYG